MFGLIFIRNISPIYRLYTHKGVWDTETFQCFVVDELSGTLVLLLSAVDALAGCPSAKSRLLRPYDARRPNGGGDSVYA